MSLARFGVTRPVPVNLLMAAFLLGGVVCASLLTREFFPEMTPSQASLTLRYPGATPEEVEEGLARKIEDAVSDLDEVEQITTTLAEGGGGMMVEFKDGVDVSDAVDEVERAIDALRDLPDEAEKIEVREFEPSLPVILVSLFGEADEAVMKRAMMRMSDDLETLPGMGDLEMVGARDFEIRIDVDDDALLEHRISLPEVSTAIRGWMRDIPGGSVRTNTGTFNIRALGVEEDAQAIREIVVRATPDGQTLRLGDIATITEEFVDQQFGTRFATREAGGRSVSLTVFKVGDQDAVAIAEMVRAYVAGRRGDAFEQEMSDRVFSMLTAMAKMGERPGRPAPAFETNRYKAWKLGNESAEPLPPGTNLATNSDLARFIEGRLDLLLRNAKWGALLVFGTLLIFLNWRVAFWVGVGLTTALAGTLMVMYIAGVTLNLLTMFGLIVVLGLLVDDAIVVAENIQARHDRHEPSLVAAIRGTDQVFWPVVATVLTSIVAFLPLTFIRGTIGDLLGALPYVVTCALAMSLVESILILPSHMGHSLAARDRAKPGRIGRALRKFEMARDHVILDIVIPIYARVLEFCIRWRYVSLSAATCALLIAVGMVVGGRVPFTFLPVSDSETVIVDIAMPIGTPIEDTTAIVERLELAARSQPEVKSISTYIGVRTNVDDTSGATNGGLGAHLGQLFIELLPTEERDRQSSEVSESIRAEFGSPPGLERMNFSEIQGGPGGPDITVQVTGEDIERVNLVAEEVKLVLASKAGVVDITDDDSDGQREVQVSLKPGAAALGFTVANVAQQVRGALFGLDPHVFSDRREDIDVRVRLDENARRSLHTIENMWVISPTGERVPLCEIASLEEGTSYSSIKRINRRRAVTVTADTTVDANPEEIVPALRPDFERLMRAYPDVVIEEGGRQRQLAKAFSSLPIGFLAASVMIYVILAWLFGSYIQPLTVMAGIPFGTIGIVWGHLIMGYELTFLSVIGGVALSGIVVNDSLILVEFYNGARKEGLSVHEALVKAGRQRLRPIALTTITTVLGLTPLMLEQSFQAKFLIPMAISIAFGLMAATFVILLVLPCLVVAVEDIRRTAYYLWHGRTKPDAPPSAVADLPGVE